MHETVQYVADLLTGSALIIASLFHVGWMAVATFSLGAFLILLPVVGSNIAGYVAAKRGIVIGESDSK